MSSQIVLQECPIKMSNKSVKEERLTRVSGQSVLQECPTRMSYKSVTRMSTESIGEGVSSKNVLQV